MPYSKTRRKNWINIHQTFKQKVAAYYNFSNHRDINDPLERYNNTTEELMQFVSLVNDEGMTLRVVGGGWSWPKIAATDGIMINSKPLNLTFRIGANLVSSEYKNSHEDLYFAQCGVSINELNKQLSEIGRSLSTSGASNGQTIAGALSTGTHGGAIDFGSMPEFVVGLHIITGPNQHYYLERKSYSVVSDHFISRLGTTLLRDDDLFNSALVSFGAFGIIHGVMIETEEIFDYEAKRKTINLNEELRVLLSTLDFDRAPTPIPKERPYHFGIVYNPYIHTNNAHVTYMYKRKFREKENSIRAKYEIGISEDAVTMIGKLFDFSSVITKVIINKMIKSKYKDYETYGTQGEIFSNTSTGGKVLSLAIAIPMKEVLKVINLYIELIEKSGTVPCILALRYVAKSSALLGFTKYDPSCVVEIDGTYSKKVYKLYEAFAAALDEMKIEHTYHWGKVIYTNKTKLIAAYGEDAVNKWIVSRNQLIKEPAMLELFSNQLLKDWGLDTILPSVPENPVV